MVHGDFWSGAQWMSIASRARYPVFLFAGGNLQ